MKDSSDRLSDLRDHFASKFSVYIISATAIGLLCYYFFAFVPKNEQELNEHADRLLNNKAVTIYEKYKGFEDAIASSPTAYFAKWYFTIKKDTSPFFMKEVNDSVHFWTSVKDDTARCRVTYKDLKNVPVDDKLIPQIYGPTKNSPLLNIWQVNSGNNFFVFGLPLEFVNEDASGDTIQPFLWASINTFTSNLKSNRFFDDLFLLSINDDNANTGDLKERGFVPSGTVLDKSALGLTHFAVSDTTKHTGIGIFEIKIGGQNYKAYARRIHLKRNLDVYVIGLINKKNFQSMASEVPAWFIVFCLVAGLALIFLMPLIKLYVLKQNERLSSLDSRLSVFSMISFVSLVTIILSGIYVFWSYEKKEMDKEMYDLAKKVKTNLGKELDQNFQALSDPELFSQPACVIESYKLNKFNEIFDLNGDGEAQQVLIETNEKNKALNLSPYFRIYPFNLKKREYFKNAKSQNSNQDYSLVAINSYSTGRSEAAISTYSAKDKTVRVLTSRLPSVVRAIVPAPYRMVVTDQNGNVKFHSQWREIQSENFISECKDDEGLRASIQNSIEGPVEFSYLRNECDGYGIPLEKGWHLIVFYEEQQVRNLAAEVFGLCIFSLLIVLVLLGIIQLVLSLDQPASKLLHTRTFFYHWLNANSTSSIKWIALCGLNAFLFFCQVAWSFLFHSTILSLFFIAACILFFYLYSYGCLNQIKIDRIMSSRAMRWFAYMLGASFLTFIFIAQKTQLTEALYFLGFFILGLLLCSMLLRNWRPSLFVHQRSYAGFRLFMASSLLVMAVGPSWIFVTDHYYYGSLSKKYELNLLDVKQKADALINPYESPNLAGDDYTYQNIPNCSQTRTPDDLIDIGFYKFLQKFKSTAPSMSGNTYDRLPNTKPYQLFQTEDSAVVRLTIKGKEPITIARPLQSISPQLTNSTIFVAFFTLLIGVIIWQSLDILPRKIFYSPDVPLWESYPQQTAVNFLEKEFEGDHRSVHPLQLFPEKQKATLIGEARNELLMPCHSLREVKAIKDKYILRLQSEANELYENIWAKCLPPEQYFLYDLSSDGVTNLANEPIIKSLSEKGLIRINPSVEIVNRSFANFILTKFSREQLAAWDEREGREGSWNNLKWIGIIVISAVFVFLSLTIKDFLGRIGALLTPLTIMLPKIFNLISEYSGFQKKDITKP